MIALVIAANGLKQTVHSREAIFWIFIGPLLMSAFFGVLFRPQPPPVLTVDLVNADADDSVASSLADGLQHDGLVVHRTNAVTPGRLAIVVPAGTAAAIAAGARVELTLHAGRDETRSEADVRLKVTKILIASALGVKATDPPGPFVVAKTTVGASAREVTAGFQRSVPSYMVMFVFLNLLVSGAGIAEERKLGLLRRLGMAPITRRDIALGKLLSRFAIGWIQMAWMLLAGRVLFHIQWAEHAAVFVAFLTLFALASASLGLFFGTVFRDPDKCRAAAIWSATLLAPLGGLWWPIEIVGPTLKRVSHLVPTGWAMEPINAMLAFGAGAREVLHFAAAFLALFVVTFVAAVRRLEVI